MSREQVESFILEIVSDTLSIVSLSEDVKLQFVLGGEGSAAVSATDFLSRILLHAELKMAVVPLIFTDEFKPNLEGAKMLQILAA